MEYFSPSNNSSTKYCKSLLFRREPAVRCKQGRGIPLVQKLFNTMIPNILTIDNYSVDYEKECVGVGRTMLYRVLHYFHFRHQL